MAPPRGGKGARGGRGSKPVRGGGKKFSRNLKPLDGNGDEMPGMWDGARQPEEEDGSSEDESSEEEEEESSEEEDAGPAQPSKAEMTREEKRAAQKALKDAKRAQAQKAQSGGGGNDGGLSSNDSFSEDEKPEEIAKPKQPVAAAKGFSTNNLNSLGASGPATEQPLTRREREVIEAAAAKERYRKLHEAGKTDEAKNDLARLALIRKDREEKAKQRAAEMEEKKRVAEIKALASGKRK